MEFNSPMVLRPPSFRPFTFSDANDQTGNGVLAVTRGGRILFANEAVSKLTGWSQTALIDADFAEIFRGAAGTDSNSASLQPLLETKDWEQADKRLELELWRGDQSSVLVELTLLPSDAIQAAGADALILLRDVSRERRQAQSLRLAASLFDHMTEGMVILDPDFRVSMVNSAFLALTGQEQSDIIGQYPLFLDPAGIADGSLAARILDSLRTQGRWEHEFAGQRGNQDYIVTLSLTGGSSGGAAADHYLVSLRDITERKRDQERLRYQARYDALTGLPNRAHFMELLTEHLGQAESADEKLAVMYVDLDGFKLINDTLGHVIGDELLKEVAQRLPLCVGAGDRVTRFGGDEFTILLPAISDPIELGSVAKQIIEIVKLPFAFGGNEAYISASVGIALFPGDGRDTASLLKNANAAMHRAKESGHSNFEFYRAGLDGESKARLSIKTGLSKALERQEFELLYQPKADVATGRLTGAEGLLRWNSRDLGLMLPESFIPILEDTGMIDPVGEWVLETACRQYRLWRDAGYGHMRVAVNLSVRQLRQGSLVKTVETLLQRYGIEPSGIELEITESMIMKDTANAVAVLKDLSAMGVPLTMDDFGTGYSSLSYLKRFPQNTIKIDRSFVRDIAVDPDDLEIIRTIINMGHSLRRKVVAEGVETEAQRLLLRHLRCDEMQGYLLSPPVPAAEIDRMLASTRHGNEV